jgi:hypothetical protein
LRALRGHDVKQFAEPGFGILKCPCHTESF